MTNTELTDTSERPEANFTERKRVAFTMGGKRGVSKTGVTLALADWFEARQIPCALLDLDIENKAVGSLKHYLDIARKVNIHTLMDAKSTP